MLCLLTQLIRAIERVYIGRWPTILVLPGTKGFPRIHVKPDTAPVLETESISETENIGNSLSNHKVRYYREPDYLFRHKC